MTLFRNGKRPRDPLSQTDRSNRLEDAADSSSNSSSDSSRKRRKSSPNRPSFWSGVGQYIASVVAPRSPFAPRARLASPKRRSRPRNMAEVTNNALRPLPPSTITLNARQTSSSFPTTLPPPPSQPPRTAPAPTFRPHASTSTLSSAAKYKWDVMDAKAAGQPPPPKPSRESLRGGGYRKKEPIGIDKRKEAVEERNNAIITQLGKMQLDFKQGQAEGYEGTMEDYPTLEQYRATVNSTLPLDAFETSAYLPSKMNRSNKSREIRRPVSDLSWMLDSFKKTSITSPHLTKSLEDFRRLREEIDRAAEADLVQVPKTRRFPSRLSAEDQAIVNASLSDSAFDVSMPGAQVQAKDIRKLKGLSWINDEIITFYAIMINLRSNAEEARIAALPDPKPKPKEGDLLKVWSFNSFFYAKFTSSQFAGVKRWTKKVDVFAKDVVIIPVNQGNSHWVCAAINITKKRFEFYDSMGHQRQDVYKKLRAYLAAEHLDKKKSPIDLSDWEDYWDPDVPQQSNGSDCGIFTCQFMECLSRRVDGFDFAQENMIYLRNKMILEITKSQLIPEKSFN